MIRLAFRLTAAALLACSPVIAEDAVDRALTQLGAEDIATREAASKVIEEAGAQALKRSEDLLAATKDPEVRVRLQALIPWLKIDATTPAFLKACGDQWFAWKEGNAITGVEHHTAELTGEGGDRRWTFIEEAWLEGDEGSVLYARHRVVARHNLSMTLLEVEYEEDADRDDRRKGLWRFREGRIEVLDVGCDDPNSADARWLEIELQGAWTGTVVPIGNVERIFERATINGIDSLEFQVIRLERDRARLEPAKFTADARVNVEVAGRSIEALVWKIPAYRGPSLIVSREFGFVGLDADAPEEEFSFEMSDEKTCRATGLVKPPSPTDRKGSPKSK